MLLSASGFYDRCTGIYDDSVDTFEILNENKLRRKLAEKYIPNGSKVLDLGCGTGFGYTILNDIVEEYIGLDISIALLDVACTKFQNAVIGGRAEFRYRDLEEKLDYPDESFDSVVSFYGSCSHLIEEDSMEHLAEEIYRVLKPDSYAIIDLLSKYSLDRILHHTYNTNTYSITWAESEDITRVRFYTPATARNIFRDAGFEVESVTGVTILADRNLPFREIFQRHPRLGQLVFNLEKQFNSYFPFNALGHALIVVAYRD